MREALRTHKLAVIVTAALGVVVAAILAFGVFGIHTAFTNKTVTEAGPTFTASATGTAAAASTAAATPATVVQGTFSGADAAHNVAGQALVLSNGTEQRFLRLTQFESSNGPDLKVYLRAANGQFVSLGKLKGNVGDQNYEIPRSVDLDTFNTVQIWCERFSVSFGQAVLA